MKDDPLSPPCRLCVFAADAGRAVEARARALSDQLDLPICRFATPPCPGTFDLIVAVTPERIELRENTGRRARPVFVDFTAGSARRRRETSQARNQPLARALGIQKGMVSVIDATAGFLADTFHLACLGCHVLALERVPLIALLALDGLNRGLRSGDAAVVDALQRIRLVGADAIDLLSDAKRSPGADVVYLDPMYPVHERRALPRKDLRIARWLVGDDADADALLATARGAARHRTVVKRHPSAPPLAEPVSIQFSGRTVRYDVYLTAPRERGGSEKSGRIDRSCSRKGLGPR